MTWCQSSAINTTHLNIHTSTLSDCLSCQNFQNIFQSLLFNVQSNVIEIIFVRTVKCLCVALLSSSRWCVCQLTPWGRALVLQWQCMLPGGWSTLVSLYHPTGQQWAHSHLQIDTSLELLPSQRCFIHSNLEILDSLIYIFLKPYI